MKKIVTYKYHVGNSTESRYNIILVRYILATLRIGIKFSNNTMSGGEGPYEFCMESMVDLNYYGFGSLNINNSITTELSFLDS